MSTAPQGLFSFPGIMGVLSGSMTWQHGTAPSVCTIRAPMQTGPFPERGTLIVTYGSKRLQFPDCKLDNISVETSGEGYQVIAFNILDRRWKWRFGDIQGRYNVREGRLSRSTLRYEKTPRELAALCFQAMGEQRFNVAQLDNDARPFVEWDGSPAEALQQLVEARGCRSISIR